jgi:hypothetical protein
MNNTELRTHIHTAPYRNADSQITIAIVRARIIPTHTRKQRQYRPIITHHHMIHNQSLIIDGPRGRLRP